MRRAAVAIAVAVVVAAVVAAAVAAASTYTALGPEPVDAPHAGTRAQPGVPADVAAANNDFAVRFYKTLPVDENAFFSPTSMYVAFSALYEGAGGDTAAQMRDAFGFDPDAETRHNSTAHAMASINRDDPDAILEMANALWIADWFAPSPPYLDVARGTYLADAETVDFMGGAVDRINEWASDKTHGKITRVIGPNDVNDLLAMVLTNAIYFKGTWVNQFPEDATRESDFWTNGTESVRADLMNVGGDFEYARSDGAQILKLPYEGGRLSMLVVLPDGRDGLGELAGSLSPEQIAQWSESLQLGFVYVSMPKFEVREEYDLKPPLTGMGMEDAFDKNIADLTGIGSSPKGNLFVSKAAQHTYVNVDEEGTEAAAVTSVLISAESEGPPIPRFVADHPFLFVIQDDESGMILFMGSIANPA